MRYLVRYGCDCYVWLVDLLRLPHMPLHCYVVRTLHVLTYVYRCVMLRFYRCTRSRLRWFGLPFPTRCVVTRCGAFCYGYTRCRCLRYTRLVTLHHGYVTLLITLVGYALLPLPVTLVGLRLFTRYAHTFTFADLHGWLRLVTFTVVYVYVPRLRFGLRLFTVTLRLRLFTFTTLPHVWFAVTFVATFAHTDGFYGYGCYGLHCPTRLRLPHLLLRLRLRLVTLHTRLIARLRLRWLRLRLRCGSVCVYGYVTRFYVWLVTLIYVPVGYRLRLHLLRTLRVVPLRLRLFTGFTLLRLILFDSPLLPFTRYVYVVCYVTFGSRSLHVAVGCCLIYVGLRYVAFGWIAIYVVTAFLRLPHGCYHICPVPHSPLDFGFRLLRYVYGVTFVTAFVTLRVTVTFYVTLDFAVYVWLRGLFTHALRTVTFYVSFGCRFALLRLRFTLWTTCGLPAYAQLPLRTLPVYCLQFGYRSRLYGYLPTHTHTVPVLRWLPAVATLRFAGFTFCPVACVATHTPTLFHRVYLRLPFTHFTILVRYRTFTLRTHVHVAGYRSRLRLLWLLHVCYADCRFTVHTPVARWLVYGYGYGLRLPAVYLRYRTRLVAPRCRLRLRYRVTTRLRTTVYTRRLPVGLRLPHLLPVYVWFTCRLRALPHRLPAEHRTVWFTGCPTPRFTAPRLVALLRLPVTPRCYPVGLPLPVAVGILRWLLCYRTTHTLRGYAFRLHGYGWFTAPVTHGFAVTPPLHVPGWFCWLRVTHISTCHVYTPRFWICSSLRSVTCTHAAVLRSSCCGCVTLLRYARLHTHHFYVCLPLRLPPLRWLRVYTRYYVRLVVIYVVAVTFAGYTVAFTLPLVIAPFTRLVARLRSRTRPLRVYRVGYTLVTGFQFGYGCGCSTGCRLVYRFTFRSLPRFLHAPHTVCRLHGCPTHCC